MILSYLPLLILLSWASLCALDDAKRKRIDNRLMVAGAAVALVPLAIWQQSLTGASLPEVVLSCILALLLALPGYSTARFGAGDVKLLLVLALASDSQFLLISVAGAALGIVAWLLLAPRLWPRLSPAVQRTVPMLAPGSKVLPYAPYLLFGMILAALLS